MIKISKVIYVNEHGEEVTVDFGSNDLGVDYIVDRVTDLVREMSDVERKLGPPPLKKPEAEEPGEVPAW